MERDISGGKLPLYIFEVNFECFRLKVFFLGSKSGFVSCKIPFLAWTATP